SRAAVRQKGEWLGARLARLAARSTKVREVRGRGLMWGLDLAEPAAPYITAARERGLLVGTAGANVLRLLPPLVISPEELERRTTILGEILGSARCRASGSREGGAVTYRPGPALRFGPGRPGPASR